jgi:hypothetical protein
MKKYFEIDSLHPSFEHLNLTCQIRQRLDFDGNGNGADTVQEIVLYFFVDN